MWVVGVLRGLGPTAAAHEAGGRSLKGALYERIAFALLAPKASWKERDGRADGAQPALGCGDEKMRDGAAFWAISLAFRFRTLTPFVSLHARSLPRRHNAAASRAWITGVFSLSRRT